MIPLTGITIHQREPGTVITDERTGKSITVTERSAVVLGRDVYMTPRCYRALSDRVDGAAFVASNPAVDD